MTAHLTETDMAPFEANYERPTIHLYSRHPRYRRSGSIPTPQPGDIALCGHVKVKPDTGNYAGEPVTCEGCRTLNAMRR